MKSQLSALRKARNKATVKKAMDRELSRVSLFGFIRSTLPGYSLGKVHERICVEFDRFLADVAAHRSPRLILCMPPRHGKSEIASRRFPAYVFGRYPDMSIIGTAYSATLASRFNRDVQRIMESAYYREIFPGVGLGGTSSRGRSYSRTTEFFEIVNHAGTYRSAGVGGGITGMGGDILIIDDPVKDRAEADSSTVRDRVWDWYTSTLYTRLVPGGGIVVIMTRWNTDDLVGRLLEADRTGEGDHWKVVNFPAIAETDEEWDGELMRVAGDALHQERYSLDQLMAIKAAIGSRDWAALYQQRPVPDGGAIFREDWLRFYATAEIPQKFDAECISWDMTFKEGTDNDFAVGQVWGRAGGEFWLLDQVRARMGFTATLEAFQSLAAKWPQAQRKLVEDTANGPAIIDSLRRRVSGIIPVKPDGSKTARAHAVTTYFEAGNVLIPHPSVAPWVSDYVAELTQFPSGAHDDQVDATTQAIRDLTSHAPIRINPAILSAPSRPASGFAFGRRMTL